MNKQIKRALLICLLVLVMASTSFAAVVLLNRVGVSPSHWTGLSTDVKPTIGDYGSTFYVEDTGVLYMYGSSGWVIDTRNLSD
jgi:hypothetical protein